jgi:hypothetical protein
MADVAGVDHPRIPACREPMRLVEPQPGIVATHHQRRRHLQRMAQAFVVDGKTNRIGRRHQQRAGDGRTMVGKRRYGGQAAEAVRHHQHRLVGRAGAGGDAGGPGVQLRRIPFLLPHAPRAGQRGFEIGLPMADATVATTGHDQDLEGVERGIDGMAGENRHG